MKIKPLSWLPGAIALMLITAPVISAFTHPAYAQTSRQGQSGRQADQLNLTAEQKTKIDQIRQSARQQIENVFTAQQKTQLQAAIQQGQTPNINLTDAQKAKLIAIQQSTKDQLDAVLTPEQKQKLNQMRQDMEQRRQQSQQ